MMFENFNQIMLVPWSKPSYLHCTMNKDWTPYNGQWDPSSPGCYLPLNPYSPTNPHSRHYCALDYYTTGTLGCFSSLFAHAVLVPFLALCTSYPLSLQCSVLKMGPSPYHCSDVTSFMKLPLPDCLCSRWQFRPIAVDHSAADISHCQLVLSIMCQTALLIQSAPDLGVRVHQSLLLHTFLLLSSDWRLVKAEDHKNLCG